MSTRSTIISVSLVLGIGIASAGSAVAQGTMGGTGQGMMGPGMMQGDTNQGMMGRGTTQGGGGGMICPMMSGMMQGGQSMMGSGIMGPNMMRGSTGGMSALFGSHVVPPMNLSVDDVRGYFTAQLDRLGNKRLKIGNINAVGGTIAAEVVTVDNSLVQRMKIDRSTGNIDYEN
jgi:hypothetical protein